ncbi:MAG TPA: choice-of-anchor B family protein, partial [Vicinamibacterales bacterium]
MFRTLPALALASLLPPAGASAQGFGEAVLVTADEVLVGQSMDASLPGYVYVYRRDGAGRWTEAARLQASDAEPNDHFGRALALAQGDLLVGATIARQSGALYIFGRAADGTWRESASMTVSDADSSHSFGRVAATDGRTVLMADWAARESRGAVYVFEKRDGQWRETARLVAPDAQPEDWFGSAIAIDGDRIAVGVSRRSDNRGLVYIFRRDGETWTQAARIEPPDTAGNPQFGGGAIAFAGDALLVGATGADGFVGAVYTYRGNADGTVWTPTGKVTPPEGTPPNGWFPTTLEVADGDVWLGFRAYQTGSVSRLERGADGSWVMAETLPTDGLDNGDGFGGALSLRGDLAAVGAVNDDFGLGSVIVLERQSSRWAVAERLIGETTTDLDPIVGGRVDCAEGKAATFDCQAVDILSFLPVEDIGGARGVQVNDVWGWTDSRTGREWAIVGRYDGTSFIDISDPSNPRYVGNLPLHEGAQPNIWRDIKVYRDHAYIVADGAGPHGMQVFDLARLRDIPAAEIPVTFTEDAHYGRIASAHNIVINEETGFAYAVGASSGGETCGGALHMIDIREPKAPKFAGCFQDTETGNQRTGYSHDAQCVIYQGPDEQHRGREICFGSNETALSIA